jgi:hypothetical protein
VPGARTNAAPTHPFPEPVAAGGRTRQIDPTILLMTVLPPKNQPKAHVVFLATIYSNITVNITKKTQLESLNT